MKKILVIILVISAIIYSCAKKGRPSGGPKDIIPPVMIKSIPENYSINFTGQEIEIYFNEYVKLKDLSKQLIISPPLKNRPLISPQGGASKVVKIKIFDTLIPNTTYSFNFGKSIVDNNEGNPFSFFKYVFSTGSNIDSLKFNGSIRDAISQTADDFVSVMLYEVDTTFTDSIIYKETPRYITNTLDSTTNFNFENLKAGKYLLTALKEDTDNYLFNQKTDKIAFNNEFITIPSDEVPELILFKEIQNYKALKPKHERKNRIKFRFEGEATDKIEIKLLSNVALTSKITKEKDNDTLQYWFKPRLDIDSLNFTMSYKKHIDSFTVLMRKKIKKDSLTFKNASSNLALTDNYKIITSIPIIKIDDSKIKITDKDSIIIPFKSSIEELSSEINLEFLKTESQKYKIDILPNAFTDFFEGTNDTLSYSASTKATKEFGNIRVTLINSPKTPLVVQLVTSKGDVVYEKFGKDQKVFSFSKITPSKYNLRIVFDDNNNKKFDTGNYLNKIQPERVAYHPEEIEIRANWDVEEQFTLK
jgi:uncharacterized protein (DUF2141 family)